jgi:hypothetical protein
MGEKELRRNFTPRYSPWEQRIPIAIGFKEAVRSGRVVLKTDEIERFTASGVQLKSGEELKCDVCILATGFELNFLKFRVEVDGAAVDQAGINFYKGLMMGGVPNYFQPVGVWHSAWTQRSETSTRFAAKIIRHMGTAIPSVHRPRGRALHSGDHAELHHALLQSGCRGSAAPMSCRRSTTCSATASIRGASSSHESPCCSRRGRGCAAGGLPDAGTAQPDHHRGVGRERVRADGAHHQRVQPE